MSVTILIPGALRPSVGGQNEISVNAATVGEALGLLTTAHQRVKNHLFQEDGRLRSFVNIYVNDRDIRELDREATKLAEGDEIAIVPSMAGG